MIQNFSLSSLQCLLVSIFSIVFAKISIAFSSVDGSVCIGTFQMVFLGFVWKFFFRFSLKFFLVFLTICVGFLCRIFGGYLVDSFGF